MSNRERTPLHEALVMQTAAVRFDVTPDTLESRRVRQSFFQRWTIFRVQTDDMPPRVVHVAEHGGATVIPSYEAGFAELTAVESPAIGSPEDAVRYVEMFLDVTTRHVFVVQSVDEFVTMRPGSSERYRGVLGPPRVERRDGGFVVEAWLLDVEDLRRAVFSIDAAGTLHVTSELVEASFGLVQGSPFPF